MFKKFFEFRLALLAALCLALVLLTVLTPSKSDAQVLSPCSTFGCTMTGTILYSGGIPAVTGTGTPTIQAGSTNTAGQVTAGASATSVVITFANGGYLRTTPFCQVESLTQLAAFSYTVSLTAITITQTATSGNSIVYECNPSS